MYRVHQIRFAHCQQLSGGPNITELWFFSWCGFYSGHCIVVFYYDGLIWIYSYRTCCEEPGFEDGIDSLESWTTKTDGDLTVTGRLPCIGGNWIWKELKKRNQGTDQYRVVYNDIEEEFFYYESCGTVT